eukprot:6194153-Pleurochrysis_carterae.AAC.4
MRASSRRSQVESARFEGFGACWAGGPDATPTLRRGASVPLRPSSVHPVPTPVLPPPEKTFKGDGAWGELFARLIVRWRRHRARVF